jgi:PIN domain nuclease of toxin-antitoxin system
MTYLLDTHAAIWALMGNDDKMSAKVKSIIADRTGELAISIASAWELAIKMSKGGKTAGMNGVTAFIDMLSENGVKIVGITPEEVKLIEALPFIHKDPFDRIIIATAICNDFTLVSVDENNQKYDVKWVW